MPKITAKEWEARAKDAEQENHLLTLGMRCALAGELEQVDKVKTKDGATFKFAVARLTSPHGGLFFTAFSYPEQCVSYNVQYLDKVITDQKNNPLSEFAQIRSHAVETATIMRFKLLEAQK